MSTSLTHRSATELARLIRDRAVSAAEVMDAPVMAIERLNPRLNAIVAVAEDAREQAAAHDRALARGHRIGPLHSVPFTAKDIETAGLPTTLGMVELAGNRPARDATILARMRSGRRGLALHDTTQPDRLAVRGGPRQQCRPECRSACNSSADRGRTMLRSQWRRPST